MHLTWENEAHLEVEGGTGRGRDRLPADQHPRRAAGRRRRRQRRAARAPRDAAEAYLEFLYTPEGQEIIAKHFYRPTDPAVLQRHAETFPDIKLFPITAIAKDWDDANDKFFGEGEDLRQHLPEEVTPCARRTPTS